jgi:hypothetical protein
MKWGMWHKSSPVALKPLATCEAYTYDEACRILLPKSPITDVVIEPLLEKNKSNVGRYYTQTGPVLTEEDLKNE